jgi:Peptidase C13 family
VARSPDKYVPNAQGDALLSFVSILSYWAAVIGIDLHRFGETAGINPDGAQWALAWTAVMVGGLLVGAVIGAAERFGRLVWQTFFVLTAFLVGAYAYAIWQETTLESITTKRLFQFAVIGGLVGGVVGEHWYGRAGVLAYVLAPLAFLGAFFIARDGLVRFPILLQERPEVGAAVPQPTVEEYSAAQEPLLAAQIAALEDGRDGEPQLFALLAGGYAQQSVFLNEVEGVGKILDAQFSAGSRTIALANSIDKPLSYPEVSWDSLEASLDALSAVMGPEDMLLLFMTSHGSTDAFGVTFHPASGRSTRLAMAAGELAGIFNDRVRNPAVVIVSSCKSGSFVDDFSAENRLVITASAADRNSFGCRDGRDWTDFGQHFFDTSLRAEPDFRKAFAQAMVLVEDSERWRPWARASQPQIAEGEGFGAALDLVLAARSQAASD